MTDTTALNFINKSQTSALLLLCECRGKIVTSPIVESVRMQARDGFAGLHVRIVDNLCSQPHKVGEAIAECKPSSVVIGACHGEGYDAVWEGCAAETGLPPFFIETVDLLSLSSPDNTPRAGAAICSALSHQRAFKQVPLHAIRPARLKTDAKLSRRSLLRLSFTRRYEIIPWIESGKCAGPQGCDLCMNTCLSKAIDPKSARINRSECVNCGLCLSKCPTGALEVPGFRPLEIGAAIAPMIDSGAMRSRIIIFTIGQSPSAWHELADNKALQGILTFHLPYENLLTPWLLLLPLTLGADGVGVFHNHPEGSSREGKLKEMIEFTNTLMNRSGATEKTAEVFNFRNINAVRITLEEFCHKLAHNRIGKLPVTLSDISYLEGPKSFSKLLKQLWSGNNKAIEPIVHIASPIAMINLDTDKCSTCGLCADRCPTGALKDNNTERGYSLTFEHAMCSGCGICENMCPEKALHLFRRIEPNLISGNVRLELGFFPIELCSSCHSPIETGSRSQILSQRLNKTNSLAFAGLNRSLSLCQQCRRKQIFASARKDPLKSEVC